MIYFELADETATITTTIHRGMGGGDAIVVGAVPVTVTVSVKFVPGYRGLTSMKCVPGYLCATMDHQSIHARGS